MAPPEASGLDPVTHDPLVGTEVIVSTRPGPQPPRPYRFPQLVRSRLANGLSIVHANLPGRRMVSVRLVLEGGAAEDPSDRLGLASLVAAGLSEGTQRRSAVEFLAAAESLGAELRADAGWHTVIATAEVPRDTLGPALELLAEMVREPSFPAREIARLKDERLNDLRAARGDPKRVADLVYMGAIYAPDAAYGRPLTGVEETLARVTRDAVMHRHLALARPESATLVIAGDLADWPLGETLETSFGRWTPEAGSATQAPARSVDAATTKRRVLVLDRPGAPQTELRIGHVGLRRHTPDYFGLQVMVAILGGLFNSRLQTLLRDERGYTYGVTASFDLRRGAGPFAIRTAVQADATGDAVRLTLDELRRIRREPVTETELAQAREYLTGSFALRHATATQVAGAVADVVAQGLPDDELDRYREGILGVDAESVGAAARHVDPDAAVVLAVGDGGIAERSLRDQFDEIERVRVND